ncbi:Uncharacterised protein [Bordetella ansorpii]|uniref:Uncharacterized protein n=1 Tax=Bordetella ansorpii TaxID=288768 RepID=A0A157RNV0_9BORD|nr:hypothetical protein [Bordetella ansorpii]SAI59643.1 Uncharacterised protein [Bordetella ansorpii]
MSLDPSIFAVHDIREFPFVVFDQAAAKPGHALQWEAEMVALMRHAQPFVVVYDQLDTDETHEDRKHRGVWLKRNKEPLGLVCKALISIEPDNERRAGIQAKSEGTVKAFGAVATGWQTVQYGNPVACGSRSRLALDRRITILA